LTTSPNFVYTCLIILLSSSNHCNYKYDNHDNSVYDNYRTNNKNISKANYHINNNDQANYHNKNNDQSNYHNKNNKTINNNKTYSNHFLRHSFVTWIM